MMSLVLITPPRRLYWPDLVYQIQEVLDFSAGVYLVGGMVRDAYRDHPFKDIDLACQGDGRQVARKIANQLGGKYYELDERFQIGRALVEWAGDSYIIDVASLRGPDLLADLAGRDFTINALAVPLEDEELQGIYDPLGGLQDWHDKLLRQCSPHALTDDPVRALRAIRQSLAFGLKLDPATKTAIKAAVPLLPTVSMERRRDEFFAILGGKKPKVALLLLQHLGLLTALIPDVERIADSDWPALWGFMEKLEGLLATISPHRDDNIAANVEYGTLVYLLDRFRGDLQNYLGQTFANGRRGDQVLLLAGLLMGLGHSSAPSAAQAEQIAIGLYLTVEEQRRLAAAIRHAETPLRLAQSSTAASEVELYRYWASAQEDGLQAILLSLALYLIQQGVNFRASEWTKILLTMQHLLAWRERAAHANALLTGHDLMQHFNLPPGKHIGLLLAHLREANALGHNPDPTTALQLAQAWLETSED